MKNTIQLRISLLIAAAALVLVAVLPATALADGPFVNPSGGNARTIFCLFAGGFKPYETIALWIQNVDGNVYPAGYAIANSHGAVGHAEGSVPGYACWEGLSMTATWKPGQVLFVARGLSSKHEASAKFWFLNDWVKPDGAGLHQQAAPSAPVDSPLFTFASSGFKPYERYSFWVQWPTGKIAWLPDSYADAQGHTYSWIDPAWLGPAGDYLVVIRSASGVEFSTHLNFLGIKNPLPVGASMTVNPDNGTYQTIFAIHGGGFAPYEPVSVWFNEPNGQPYNAGTWYADDKGIVTLLWTSQPGEPFGTYTGVMLGQKTHVRVTGTFDVHPFPLNP